MMNKLKNKKFWYILGFIFIYSLFMRYLILDWFDINVLVQYLHPVSILYFISIVVVREILKEWFSS